MSFWKTTKPFLSKDSFQGGGQLLFYRIMASLYIMNRKSAIFSINISANTMIKYFQMIEMLIQSMFTVQ